jgi:hypothetical protein
MGNMNKCKLRVLLRLLFIVLLLAIAFLIHLHMGTIPFRIPRGESMFSTQNMFSSKNIMEVSLFFIIGFLIACIIKKYFCKRED